MAGLGSITRLRGALACDPANANRVSQQSSVNRRTKSRSLPAWRQTQPATSSSAYLRDLMMKAAAASANKIYPGHDLGTHDVLALAETFRAGAIHLLGVKPLGRQKSCAPYRLLAIQAIELYLNAYLLKCGHQPPTIRGMQHDLAMRAELVRAAGMILKLK